MKLAIDTIEPESRQIYLRKINWNVVLPNIIEEFEETTRTANEVDLEFRYKYKLDRLHRCIELSAATFEIEDHQIHCKSRKEDGQESPDLIESFSLTISQDADGFVAAILQRGNIGNQFNSKKPIVWGVFNSPAQISRQIIRQMLADFRTYMQVSSPVLSHNYRDRKCIERLEVYSRQYTEDGFKPAKWAIHRYLPRVLIAITGICVGIAASMEHFFQ